MTLHFKSLLFIIVCAVAILWSSGFENAAIASNCVTQTAPASGTPGGTDYVAATYTDSLSQYGFSVGMVYCMKDVIRSAVKSNLAGLNKDPRVLTYRYLVLAMALIMTGLKMMRLGMQSVTSELAHLGFRIAIAFFMMEFALDVYTAIVASMDQLISMVTTGLTTTFANNPASSCVSTTAPAGSYNNEYLVWQEFDCMFKTLLGISPSGTTSATTQPTLLFSSIAFLIAVSVFSGTLGTMLFATGTTMIMSAVLMLARCLVLVLMTYVLIGLMICLTPFIAPLLMLENQYFSDLFKRWVGIMISSVFQPMLVIGFLSFAVFVVDAFVDGLPTSPYTDPTTKWSGHTFPNCVPPDPPYYKGNPGSGGSAGTGYSTTTTGDCVPNDPVNPANSPGGKTMGSGVCPIALLLERLGNTNAAPVATGQVNPAMKCIVEPNSTLANVAIGGSPQGQTTNGSGMMPKGLNQIATLFKGEPNQGTGRSAALNISGVTKIHEGSPFYMLTVSTLCLALVCVLLKQLIDVVPDIAKNLTISVSVMMFGKIAVPFEGKLKESLGKLNASMSGTAKHGGSAKDIARKGLESLKGDLENTMGLGGK